VCYHANPHQKCILGSPVAHLTPWDCPRSAFMVEAWATGVLMFLVLALTDANQTTLGSKVSTTGLY
jgi:glycerol uptake facilitator-like aquaporin